VGTGAVGTFPDRCVGVNVDIVVVCGGGGVGCAP